VLFPIAFRGFWQQVKAKMQDICNRTYNPVDNVAVGVKKVYLPPIHFIDKE
jgi:hypothetical protein